MGSHHRPEAVVGELDAADPFPQRLVDGVLEGAAAGGDGDDLGAQELHPEDVEGLALDVDLAHVDPALEAEQGGGGGGGDPVLAGARLRDHPPLAHALGEQGLADDVVELVGAGVVEVLPLEEDPDAEALRQPVALGDGRGPAAVVAEEPLVAGVEGGVGPRLGEGGLQLGARRDQGFGQVAAAEVAEAATSGRVPHEGRAHRRRLRAWAPWDPPAGRESRGVETGTPRYAT